MGRLKYIYFFIYVFLLLESSFANNVVSERLLLVKDAKTVSEAISIYSQIITLYHLDPSSYCLYDKAFKEGGDLCFKHQRYIEALEFYTLDVEVARKCGNMRNYAASLGNIGTIYGCFQDYRRASFYYDRSYKIAVESNNLELAGMILFHRMINACNAGDVQTAKKYYNQRKQFELHDKKQDKYQLLIGNGLIAEQEHRYSDAISSFRNTLQYIYSGAMDSVYGEPVLLELGKCFFEKNLLDSAFCYFQQSEDFALKYNMSAYLADTYLEIQKAYVKTGNYDEAKKYEEKYNQLFDDIYNSERILEAQNQLFESESKAHEEEINSLSSLIEKQLSVIIIFLILIIGLVVLLVIIHKQKNNQIESYKLLIEKNRELADKNMQSQKLREKYLQIILEGNRGNAKMEGEPVRINSSYSLSSLQTEELLEKISSVMDSSQLVFDSNFNFDILCREVGSNSKYVSMVLNSTYKKNFKTLLNERRVQEATVRLHGEECTIQDLAVDLGYSNTTSFIIAFKKIIGMTPAVYRKLIKNS